MSLAITRLLPYFSRSAGISSDPICPPAPVTRIVLTAWAEPTHPLAKRPTRHGEAALVELAVQRLALLARERREGRAHGLPGGLTGEARHGVLERWDHRELLHGEAQIVERGLALVRIRALPMCIEPVDRRRIDVRGGADAALAAVAHVREQERLRSREHVE